MMRLHIHATLGGRGRITAAAVASLRTDAVVSRFDSRWKDIIEVYCIRTMGSERTSQDNTCSFLYLFSFFS